jgi:hypothetical protein
MRTKWRYLTDEEGELALTNRPGVPAGDELLDIFEVVSGGVSKPEGGGFGIPPGSFVRLLEVGTQEKWAYRAISLTVKMNDMEVGIKDGSLVAILPRNYREVAGVL